MLEIFLIIGFFACFSYAIDRWIYSINEKKRLKRMLDRKKLSDMTINDFAKNFTNKELLEDRPDIDDVDFTNDDINKLPKDKKMKIYAIILVGALLPMMFYNSRKRK